MYKFICLACVLFFVSEASWGEIIIQTPTDVGCILQGTGTGNCNIIFPVGSIPCIANDSTLTFNAESGILGRQVYSMALAAVATGQELEVSVICDSNGNGTIDWIKIKR